MRNALGEVMTRMPSEHSTMSIKTYLAECIRKIATQGQISHDELVAAVARSIQAEIAAGCLAQVNAQDLDRHWMLLPSMLSKPAF
jgi:hypothetical protein